MARLRFARSRRSHASSSLVSYFVPRLAILLFFVLLLLYLLRKQQQRFSEIRLPSGVLRAAE
jgi:flagellar biogenesis protein FliO